MNIRILLILSFVLIGVVGVNAALSDNLVSYWTFDDSNVTGSTLYDSQGSRNLTIVGATTGGAGIIGQSFSFDSSNDYLHTTGKIDPTNGFSISFWATRTATTALDPVFSQRKNPGANDFQLGFDAGATTGSQLIWGTNPGTYTSAASYAPIMTSWTHFVYTYDGVSNASFYQNGTLFSSHINANVPENTSTAVIQIARDHFSNYFGGKIDEFGVWERHLNASEANDLYNSGSGLSFNEIITPPTPGNTTYVSLTAIDAYDGSSINTFNASVTNTSGTYDFSTTNGTIVTDIPDNTTSLYNITFISEDYFSNESLNVNVSSGTYQATMAQAYVSYKCLEKYTNNSLDCAQNGPFPRKLGSYTDTINVTDYYSVSETYNLTSYFNVPVGEATLPRRTLIANYTWDGSWLNPESLILDPNSGSGARTTLTDGTSTFYFNTTSVTGAAAYILAPGGYSGNVNPGCNAQEPFMARVRSVSISTGGSGVYLECYDGSNWDLLGSSSSAAFTTAPLARAIRYNQEYFAVEATDFFDYNLTVQADDYAGNPESDFNITLQNTVLGIAYFDTASGTTITYELLSGYTYATVLNATSTIYGDPVNQIGYANITNTTAPPTSETYQFNLTAARPITISIYYEENLSLFEREANITLVPLTDSSSLFLNLTISNGSETIYNIPVSEYRVRALAAGYHDEDRFIVLGTYTGSTVDLYMRENSTGDEKQFNIINSRNVLQNGWYIRFQRYYNDTGWVTVDEARSNVDGVALQNVLENDYYRLILLNSDFEEEYRSDRTLLLESVYQISSDTSVVTNSQINKVLGVGGVITFNPTLNTITATGSSSSGSRDWKLELYRYYTDGSVLISNTTATGDSVSLSLSLPEAEARYEAVLSIIGSEITIATNGYNRGLGPESFGTSGGFYAFILLLGIVGLAVFSAPAAIVLSIFSIIISNIVGILSISIGAIVGLAIVGGMILYRRNN